MGTKGARCGTPRKQQAPVRGSSAGFSARNRRFLSLHTDQRVVAAQRPSDLRLIAKLRVKCKVIVMTDLADDTPKEVLFDMGISRRLPICLVRADRWRTIGDIRYTPDPELRREPQMGRSTIAELRTLFPTSLPMVPTSVRGSAAARVELRLKGMHD